MDAADIGFPANGNSSSWSDLEHNRGNNTSRDEDCLVATAKSLQWMRDGLIESGNYPYH